MLHTGKLCYSIKKCEVTRNMKIRQFIIRNIFFLLLPIVGTYPFISIMADDKTNIAIPDSLLTEDYIYEFTFSDFPKAVRIIELMRERKLLPLYRLDIAEGDLYFNTGKYYQGLKYYHRALESDSVRSNDTDYMEQLHRMISSYDCLHDEVKKAHYVKLLLQKSKACGNIEMQSVALFNMGKMLYYQEDRQRGYQLMEEAIELMKKSDYKYKYDNLRYDYHTLLIMLQLDKRYAEALKILDLLTEVVTKDTEGTPAIGGLAEKEKKTMYAQRTVILFRLKRVKEAEETYRKWRAIGHIYDKDNYLITPYLMARKEYDEVIRLHIAREKFLRAENDTINYHTRTIKRLLGKAYEAKGDYKKAAEYFEELTLLTDSLKAREQKSAALELASVYETNEKEAQLNEQSVRIKIRTILLLSFGGVILLLVIFFGRYVRHTRIIRNKNVTMASTIEKLLIYKDELRGSKEENRILKEKLRMITLSQLDEPSVSEEIIETTVSEYNHRKADERVVMEEKEKTENQLLFDELERMLIDRKLFLNTNLSRDDLMQLIHVGKNRIARIVQQCTGTNLTGYINRIRLEHATRLLKQHSNYTVTSIAEACGFSNVRTFHRLFREAFGMTPAEYRATDATPHE